MKNSPDFCQNRVWFSETFILRVRARAKKSQEPVEPEPI